MFEFKGMRDIDVRSLGLNVLGNSAAFDASRSVSVFVRWSPPSTRRNKDFRNAKIIYIYIMFGLFSAGERTNQVPVKGLTGFGEGRSVGKECQRPAGGRVKTTSSEGEQKAKKPEPGITNHINHISQSNPRA